MSDYSHYEFIKVEKTNKLATVILNRPDSLNAINPQMHRELERIQFEERMKEDIPRPQHLAIKGLWAT